MAIKDTASKLFFSQSEIAAELCNYFLFGGVEYVKPSQLKLMDPAELNLVVKENGTLSSDNRYRDILFSCFSPDDADKELFRLGIEEQSSIDLDMLPRIMRYDADEYMRQRREGKEQIVPVFTIVVNFSTEIWRGPLSCRELCNGSEQQLIDLLPNYHIIVIEPQYIKEEFFQNNYTFLSLVLHCCHSADDSAKLCQILQTEMPEGGLNKITANLLNAILGLELEENKNGDVKMMCKGIRDLIEQGEARGEARGKAIGEARGEAKRKSEIIRIVDKALKNGYSTDIISSIMDLPEQSILMIANGDYSCI